MRKMMIATLIMGSAATLGGCARNYAGEGAALGAAVGAGVGAVTGGDIVAGATHWKAICLVVITLSQPFSKATTKCVSSKKKFLAQSSA